MVDLNKESLELHIKNNGKLAVCSKVPLKDGYDLSIAYTPGVAEPCRKIKDNADLSFEYTCRGNMVAIVSDGTRVLVWVILDLRPLCLSWKEKQSYLNHLVT